LIGWLPPRWQGQIQQSLRQNFQNYFVGQAILAVLLSILLTTAFLILQVPLGLLFGFGIGVMSLIPFGGVVSITLVSILIILKDFGLGMEVLAVAIVLGQINDNIIAPRLLGGITGLNPVWLILSLLVGAKFGGILGLLLAVPLSSFIKSTVDSLRSAAAIDSMTSPIEKMTPQLEVDVTVKS
ncbi:MAG: AI-2E family transporter, partial [Cyanothece sp. SIO1E1]|nr:AI-2E family transporter [Cyanothece sp. SIO1E1]